MSGISQETPFFSSVDLSVDLSVDPSVDLPIDPSVDLSVRSSVHLVDLFADLLTDCLLISHVCLVLSN